MRHFVAYHNAQQMGYSAIERLRVLTSKAVDDSLIGEHVWLVVGKGTSEKSYFLGSHFVIDDVSKSENERFKYQITGRDGRVFAPLVPLDDEEWFLDFRKSMQNFSLGFREVHDPEVMQAFERLAAGG